jgi:TIR domain
MSKEQLDYEVALSFAGEDRAYAAQVAAELRRRGVRVFYDEYETASLWGKNLYSHFDEIYRKRAHFCLMFLSKNYASKVWTNHEREAAQARALQENSEYILPVKLDEIEIPGIAPTIAYIDGRYHSPHALAALVIQKLQQVRRSSSVFSRVGIFLDLVYLWYRCDSAEGRGKIPDVLLAHAASFGTVTSLWASLDGRIKDKGLERGLRELGFSVSFPAKKGHSDFALLERIAEQSVLGLLDIYVIGTGDGLYYEKTKSLLDLGKEVRIVSSPGSVSIAYVHLLERRKHERLKAGFNESDFFIDDLELVFGKKSPRGAAHNGVAADGSRHR